MKTRGRVAIKKNEERYASCNCCSSSIEHDELWEIDFVMYYGTTKMRVCNVHLRQLKEEIERAIGE